MTLGFFACVGFLVDRLAYAILPPVVLTISAFAVALQIRLPAKAQTAFATLFVALAVSLMLYVVVKDGPWS
jgi:hypothetical protein